MATTFVKCVSKEHAIACRELGLLYINFGEGDGEEDWVLAMGCDTGWVRSKYGQKEHGWPLPDHFGIALEE